MAQAIPLTPTGLELWLLDAGEDVQQSMSALAHERKVSRGLVVSGIGSLTTLSVANPDGPAYPPPMQQTDGTGPYEIVSIAGTIGEVAVAGDTVHPRVHLHISASGKDGTVLGGSLRSGSTVFWKVQALVQVLASE